MVQIGGITGPGIGAQLGDQRGVRRKRIAVNIAGERQEVAIGLVENRVLTSAKERAIGMMQAIVALGIETAHMPHAPREVAAGRLDHQMVMVGHEAIGVDLESKALAGFGQRLKKSLVILVLVKDPLVPSTTIHDVVIRILILESEGLRHTEEPMRIKILSQILTPFCVS